MLIINHTFRPQETAVEFATTWQCRSSPASSRWAAPRTASTGPSTKTGAGRRPSLRNRNNNVPILPFTCAGIDQLLYRLPNTIERYVICCPAIYFVNSNPLMVGKSYGWYSPTHACFSSKLLRTTFLWLVFPFWGTRSANRTHRTESTRIMFSN